MPVNPQEVKRYGLKQAMLDQLRNKVNYKQAAPDVTYINFNDA